MAWGLAYAAANAASPYIQNFLMGKMSGEGKASARQFAYNYFLQQQAQNWNEKMYRHRYQYQVEDLEKAGINKLYGLGQAPAVTSGAGSIGMEDDQGSANARAANITQKIAMERDWSAKQVQMSKIEAETETEKEKAKNERINQLNGTLDSVNKQLENLYKKKELDAYDKKLEADLKYIKAQTENTIKQTTAINSQIAKNNAEAENARSMAKKVNQDRKLELELKQAEAENQKAVEKYYQKHPGARNINTWTSVAGKAIHNLTNGGGVTIKKNTSNYYSVRKK